MAATISLDEWTDLALTLLRLHMGLSRRRRDLMARQQRGALTAKYRPDQPRVPAGNPDGGQWTGGSGFLRLECCWFMLAKQKGSVFHVSIPPLCTVGGQIYLSEEIRRGSFVQSPTEEAFPRGESGTAAKKLFPARRQPEMRALISILSPINVQ